MPEGVALTLALCGLAATLATAVARPTMLPEGAVAVVVSLVLVASGALSPESAWRSVDQLAPTIGFLAALLILAEGCRREGLFTGLGAVMARNAHQSPRRLLALVFLIASSVTVALGLDPTILLLTPVVFATATRLRMSPKPHVYACSHLANSASLLMPISNLTNLLAFSAVRLTFPHFAALMAAPTLGAVAVEWVVFTRFFASELSRPCETDVPDLDAVVPRFAVVVLVATLLGFLLSTSFGLDPAWIAAGGAVVISLPALVRRSITPTSLVRTLEPSFLAFVLGLAVIVAAAGHNGLGSGLRSVLPAGTGLVDLLVITTVSAILANLVNNLPAILLLIPVLAPSGHEAILAALIGVNVGPNLTYVGSLATLLWRRVLRAEDTAVNLAEFLRLGAITVPAGLIASTVLLWALTRAGL